MALSTENQSPLELLREFLENDRAAGMPWTDADFRQRVDLVTRVIVPGSAGWFTPLVETIDAWRAAYTGRRAGPLEQFGPSIADSDPGDRVDSLTLA